MLSPGSLPCVSGDSPMNFPGFHSRFGLCNWDFSDLSANRTFLPPTTRNAVIHDTRFVASRGITQANRVQGLPALVPSLMQPCRSGDCLVPLCWHPGGTQVVYGCCTGVVQVVLSYYSPLPPIASPLRCCPICGHSPGKASTNHPDHPPPSTPRRNIFAARKNAVWRSPSCSVAPSRLPPSPRYVMAGQMVESRWWARSDLRGRLMRECRLDRKSGIEVG